MRAEYMSGVRRSGCPSIRSTCPSAMPRAIIVTSSPFRVKDPVRMRVWDDARPIHRGVVREKCQQVCIRC